MVLSLYGSLQNIIMRQLSCTSLCKDGSVLHSILVVVRVYVHNLCIGYCTGIGSMHVCHVYMYMYVHNYSSRYFTNWLILAWEGWQ